MFVRLAFAVATSVEPDILVIDEALSVGDGAFARKSFDRIMELKDRGATILFCSHAMYHVQALCSRALWLEGGCVRMWGPAPKVTAAYETSLVMDAPSPKGASDSKDLIAESALFISAIATFHAFFAPYRKDALLPRSDRQPLQQPSAPRAPVHAAPTPA